MEVRRTAPRLTSTEVALVLRRAADLEAEAERPGAIEGFEPAAVEDAAREVGLSPAAVRQALAELHAGTLTSAETTGPRLRILGGARPVAAEARLVTTAPDTIHVTAESFLHRQAFALRRRHHEHTVYRRRTDAGARLRRLVNVQGSIHLTGVHSVTLTVTPLGPASSPDRDSSGTGPAPAPAPARAVVADVTATAPIVGADAATQGRSIGDRIPSDGPDAGERHMVRLEAELASGRIGPRLRSTATAMTAGAAIAIGGLLLGAGVLAVVAGLGGAVAARTWLGRRLLHQRRDEVREVLAALLDVIEDPTAARQPLAPGPRLPRSTWPSAWSSSPPADSWSARGWLRGNWTVRSGRPAR